MRPSRAAALAFGIPALAATVGFAVPLPAAPANGALPDDSHTCANGLRSSRRTHIPFGYMPAQASLRRCHNHESPVR